MTRGGLGEAARIAVGAPRLWGLALAGFLARGGIVLFALPILVVPSVVGIATFVGPDAITAAGISGRFVGLLVATTTILGTWLLIGLVVGVLIELALIEAVVARPTAVDDPPDSRRGAPAVDAAGQGRVGRGRLVGRLVAVRAVSLVPFALALALASARLLDVGYQELILPSDTGAPLVGRILRGAPDAIGLIALGWLVSELEGALATRLVAIDGRSAAASLVGAVGWVARRPAKTAWVTAATLAGSVLVIAPALAAAAAAWGLVRDALLGPPEPAAAVVAVLAFVAIWGGGLALAGLVSAWRSIAWSLVVAEDHRGGGIRRSDGGTL